MSIEFHTCDPFICCLNVEKLFIMITETSRLRKVKSILISQPPPETEDSPYFKLSKKYGLEIDFIPFIKISPVSAQEFRNQRIDIGAHTAIIFTSRNAVDHFFRLARETKVHITPEMKYFCVSEQTAYYLQKYIVIRKRKIFVGGRSAADLIPIIKKHKKEKYLFPCSDLRKDDLPSYMSEEGIAYNEMIVYRTIPNDLSSIKQMNYDLIAFFSPSGVRSLRRNFPNFEQKATRIAAFGPTTAEAVRSENLILDIEAPLPEAPSMIGAIEKYIQDAAN